MSSQRRPRKLAQLFTFFKVWVGRAVLQTIALVYSDGQAGDCIDLDLGMESGSILDNNITASSEKNANTTANNGRLNSGSSWCAGTGDSAPYLQIDLQTLHIICAVSTQGNSQADQWVKTYKLKLSTDGSTWTNYEEDGQVKSLTGNEDKNSEVKHILYGVFARYLQFLPETHHGAVCLRTELFGVKLKPVPPSIIEDFSPSSVICEMQTLCVLSCHATSGSPFNYSWTKNGQVPVSEDIKIMNNNFALRPRDAEDYGVYVCHATNRFGSTAFKITVSDCLKYSTAADTFKGDEDLQNTFKASTIALSTLVFVLLIVIVVLVWRLRRTVPNNKTSTADKNITDNFGQARSSRAQHVSEPGVYMELDPRLSEGQ